MPTQISPDQWAALAAIAQVLAAFATFAAVFVAVHQWNRQWRPKLLVSIDSAFTANPFEGHQDWVCVTITNVGICTVKVTGLQYRPHRFAKMRWFHMYDHKNPLCSKLPIQLSQTDAATFFWKPDDWDKAIGGTLCKSLQASRLYKFVWKHSILLEAKTSVGRPFLAKVPRGLVARLENFLNKPE